MTAVDFEEWAVKDLEIVLGGRTYLVPPPSTEASGQLIAAAVRGEIHLGLKQGPVPEPVQAVLDSIGDGNPALGPVFQQMIDDGLHPKTIDRVAYYAVFYWARGKEYADKLAAILWAERATDGGDDVSGPKG